MIINLGEPYEFRWLDRTLTGVAVRHRKGWVTLRTSTQAFSVPVEDVLRPVGTGPS